MRKFLRHSWVILLVLGSCSSRQAGVDASLIPDGSDGVDAGTADLDGSRMAEITSYSWKHVYGPCPADSIPCLEEYVVDRSGAVQETLSSAKRTAVLSDNDRLSFLMFLDGPSLRAEIGLQTPCSDSRPSDTHEFVSLSFGGTSEVLSKEVTACSGPVYDDIIRWTAMFRHYFP